MKSINERLKCFLEKKGVRQNDFSKKINSTQQYVSALLNGNRNIGTNLANRIIDEFPDLNKVWFLTGEGSMLKESSDNNVVGNNNTNSVVGKKSDVSVGVVSDINNCISEKKELLERLKQSQEQLSNSQRQIDSLIKIISEKLK